jgi:hypothetical protein
VTKQVLPNCTEFKQESCTKRWGQGKDTSAISQWVTKQVPPNCIELRQESCTKQNNGGKRKILKSDWSMHGINCLPCPETVLQLQCLQKCILRVQVSNLYQQQKEKTTQAVKTTPHNNWGKGATLELSTVEFLHHKWWKEHCQWGIACYVLVLCARGDVALSKYAHNSSDTLPF